MSGRDISNLSGPEQQVLKEILDLLETAGIRDCVYFLNIGSQLELAATYRLLSVVPYLLLHHCMNHLV